MIWIGMLTQGNSLNISGATFRAGVPIPITADLANMLKRNYSRMFKIWQQPSDQPLPKPGVSTQQTAAVTTKDLRPRPVQPTVQEALVRPADVEVKEAVPVAGTETAKDSWPTAEEGGASETTDNAEAEGVGTEEDTEGKEPTDEGLAPHPGTPKKKRR